MKLKINQEKFEKHLSNISKALDSNPHLMILKGLIIIANESTIELIASNGNLSVKEIIKVDNDFKVDVAGKVLVLGKIFIQLIKKQEKDITLIAEKNQLMIKSKGFKSSMNLLNIDEYPKINFELTNPKQLQLDVEVLKKVIRNVSFAADEKSDNIILNGVNFRTRNDQLHVCATNRNRLAREIFALKKNTIEFDITIFAKNLKDLIPQDAENEIEIQLSDAKILTIYKTNSKTTFIILKLIDGVFPEIDKFIPKTFESALTINAQHLLSLINKASTINSESQNTLTFKIDPQRLIIESNKTEVGNITLQTEQIVWTGQEFMITFNGNFLRDAITRFEHEITLNFLGSQKQFVINGISNEGLIQLILPHRSS